MIGGKRTSRAQCLFIDCRSLQIAQPQRGDERLYHIRLLDPANLVLDGADGGGIP